MCHLDQCVCDPSSSTSAMFSKVFDKLINKRSGVTF